VFGIGPATQIYLAVGATDMRMDCTDWCVIGSNSSPEVAICLFWQRTLGLRETAGAGSLQLAVYSHPDGVTAIAIGPLGSIPFHGLPAELGQTQRRLAPGFLKS
jgi:hypothetical protein